MFLGFESSASFMRGLASEASWFRVQGKEFRAVEGLGFAYPKP